MALGFNTNKPQRTVSGVERWRRGQHSVHHEDINAIIDTVSDLERRVGPGDAERVPFFAIIVGSGPIDPTTGEPEPDFNDNRYWAVRAFQTIVMPDSTDPERPPDPRDVKHPRLVFTTYTNEDDPRSTPFIWQNISEQDSGTHSLTPGTVVIARRVVCSVRDGEAYGAPDARYCGSSSSGGATILGVVTACTLQGATGMMICTVKQISTHPWEHIDGLEYVAYGGLEPWIVTDSLVELTRLANSDGLGDVKWFARPVLACDLGMIDEPPDECVVVFTQFCSALNPLGPCQ